MQDTHSILKDFSSSRTVVYNNYLKLELGYQDISDDQVYRFYLWSELVNSHFWRCLSRVEILLRNKINSVLTKNIGQEWLITNNQNINNIHFESKNEYAIQQATTNLKNKHKRLSNDGLVSELTMGFWVHFLSISFSHSREVKKEKEIGWEYFIQEIFPGYQYPPDNPNKNFMTRFWLKEERQKTELEENLVFLNILRNRIAHHEHIFKTRTKKAKKTFPKEDCFTNLARNYSHVLQIFRWLSPMQCEQYETSSHHFYACYLMSLEGFESDVFDKREDINFEDLAEYLLECIDKDELDSHRTLHVTNQKKHSVGLFLPSFIKPL